MVDRAPAARPPAARPPAPGAGPVGSVAAPGTAPPAAVIGAPEAWWSEPVDSLLVCLAGAPQGLTAAEAALRLDRDGPNAVAEARIDTPWRLALRQFASPLVLILVAGAGLSLVLRNWVDAATILAIVALSALLGFVQELRASGALARLRSRLALTSRVWRDGQPVQRPSRELVAGDVIELAAGHLVPADGVVLQARDFLVTEASLTGESLPVEKRPGLARADAPLRERTHCVFLGSSVRSGTARVLVVRTGRGTVLAGVASRLAERPPESAFARGVRQFGELLLRVMLVVVVIVLVANQWLGRPLVESLLFAVALAVGLSPELLPAIVSVSLARGARRLAAAGVLVRRLDAIEDLGTMNVLCTDKTGTLTRGTMALRAALDAQGRPSSEVMRWAHLNAAFETGIDNPLDAAIVQAAQAAGLDTAPWHKVDEIPYDFVRKRLTIVVEHPQHPGRAQLVTKGAFGPVLAVCDRVVQNGTEAALDDAGRLRLEAFVRQQGEQGVRVLGLALRQLDARATFGVADEAGLLFAGFLCFEDPPKPDALATVHALAAQGVRIKIITGDNRHVAAHLGAAVGLDPQRLLTGENLDTMRDEALWHQASHTDLFVELDPAQKERIVRALQRGGHAVGYLGDGINDAPALHAADVGISVDQAVDVARESADIVLLQPDLEVLRRGVLEGRRTFANTLKYIQITTSANFGNMVSMALATPLLPFLPLTATQILLNNFLSDLPAMAISTDRIDADRLRRAPNWDVPALRRYMLVFGLVSSVFDLLTFWLLLRVFQAPEAVFRSGWFLVSLLTELAVVMVLRTRVPAWHSRPSTLLAGLTVGVTVLALSLPLLPGAAPLFGLVPLPAPVLAASVAIVLAYVAATEGTKRVFFGGRPGRGRAGGRAPMPG